MKRLPLNGVIASAAAAAASQCSKNAPNRRRLFTFLLLTNYCSCTEKNAKTG